MIAALPQSFADPHGEWAEVAVAMAVGRAWGDPALGTELVADWWQPLAWPSEPPLIMHPSQFRRLAGVTDPPTAPEPWRLDNFRPLERD